MAHIQKCKYCPGTVCDAEFHTECRIAHLEGTLQEARRIVDERTYQSLTCLTNLTLVLHRENWQPKEKVDPERAAEKQREFEKLVRDGEKALYLLECARKWNAEHPGQHPPTYSLCGLKPTGEALTLQL